MICPNCKKENMNEYATVCAYCGQPLYQGENAEEKAKELSAKQKKDKRNSIIITVISIILAIVVVIVVLLIPKPDKDDDTTTTQSTTESTTLAGAEESTTNADSDAKEDPTNPTKKDESTTKVSSDKPETVAEIVAYFNKNANRVKTEATKVVKNYEDREVGEIVAPDIVMGLSGLVDTLMADDTKPTEFATREEIIENFQVPKQSYVSCVTVNDVEEASCKEEGNYYVITIKVKDQNNPVIGKGTGSMFDVVEAEEVEAKAKGIVKSFTTEYTDCVVVAKFEKSTNRMVHANYFTPMKLNVTVNFLGTHDASMETSFEKDYTITY